ncbi:MAG: DUF4349 domain-containing protein [Oscillospiraceae bacterium]|jgi:hypothetical protein|nr:DUF4349 domain-containing protein [Oscillospiraceae bacterium]
MKKAAKLIFAIIGIFAVCFTAFAACGAREWNNTQADYLTADTESNNGIGSSVWQKKATPGESDGAATENTLDEQSARRKFIKDIQASIDTAQYEKCAADLIAGAVAVGGHVQSQERHAGYNRANKYPHNPLREAILVLRVPSDKLDSYKTGFEKYGVVTNITETTRDVTLDYTDLDARLKALRTERDALLKLLEQAESLQDLLLAREQLTKVRQELDSLEAQLRQMDDLIVMSTVTLQVYEVEELRSDEPKGFWASAWEGFRLSVSVIGKGARDWAEGLITILPFLLLIAIAAVVVGLIVKGVRKKRRRKKALTQANYLPPQQG